ncbi:MULTISPECIES: riboflavin synthase [Clostridium]|jgi:riboflavin synthase, alpha subunit|uniref:Riboflavin synthase n=4 Tax=Clostridium TaxID=1485 RepID=A0A0B5Q6X8_CLOBE|nr:MULTISPECIES: riboflavin synthase [Clostridium]ABR33407.1 riboflavin synthase, alpha subunit [Clostridium beijerinckii NCIMB 8052]AIU00573.1 riboflavin synthase subunit alpha [Clostridium beijerinckii ATCC 35702]AJG97964.1 riboflavin synthase subunit alpha [Clostridium beijerinckii]ALB47444.1 riboflavin synthase [Clostridium beijerinckii NRRL B-598]AQS03871.1 riboflavin synthase [Clostridium beijerinckii]
MFTGIIEEVGVLEKFSTGNGFGVMEIKCSEVLKETRVGDSIATNGVCLTVKEKYSDSFKAEVMGETLEKSNLGNLKAGDKVNLERALRLSDRLGGHIVSGHIDGVGKIVSIKEESNGTWFTISAPEEVLRYIIYKGSIGIDGISLTVAYVDDEVFKVSVIPHTIDNTILSYKKVNSKVNLECDLIGKYVEKLFGGKEKEENENSNITMEFLRKNGF